MATIPTSVAPKQALPPPVPLGSRARRFLNRHWMSKATIMKTIFSMREGFAGSLLMGALLVLAGCSLAPKYEVPSTPTTATFKEAPQQPLSPEETGTWKTAQPSDDVGRGEWWKVFGDSKLNDLEQQAL